jgi:hypothetical protein
MHLGPGAAADALVYADVTPVSLFTHHGCLYKFATGACDSRGMVLSGVIHRICQGWGGSNFVQVKWSTSRQTPAFLELETVILAGVNVTSQHPL